MARPPWAALLRLARSRRAQLAGQPRDGLAYLRPRSRRPALLAARRHYARERRAARDRVDLSPASARSAPTAPSDVDGAPQRAAEGLARCDAAPQSVCGLASDAADGRRTGSTSRRPTHASSRSMRRRVASSGRRRFQARANRRCAASSTGPATAPRRRDCSSVRATAGSSRSTQRRARSRRLSATTASCSSRRPEILQGGDARFYGMTSPPLVYDDLVITGSAVQEFPPRGAAGDVRAWDARTGELDWTFHSVPRPGERFADTWHGDGAERRSGVNVWGFMTVDVERGILYMPFAAPAFDRYGGDRHGDNLFSSSIVAADARTGRYLWHFQVVHHDIWDNDLQAPPLLFDARIGGAAVPAVAVSSKNGLLFFLNRVSGAPLHAVEERPVPASDVPGEAAAPTQPYPVVTPPLARTAVRCRRRRRAHAGAHAVVPRLDRGQTHGGRRPLPSRAPQSAHDQLSGPARRQQLGRRRLRSNDGAALSQHERPRPSHRARAFDGPPRLRTRAHERALHATDDTLAVSEAAVGAAARHRYGDGPRALAGDAGRFRQLAARQARHGAPQRRRADRHGRRLGLHRRNGRQPLSRVRRAERSTAVVAYAGSLGARHAHQLPRRGRSPVRSRDRDRRQLSR